MTSAEDPRFLAAVDLVRRTGAETFQLRYQDDEEPTVWIAVASYHRLGRGISECAAALSPYVAAMRLVDQLIDGGTCAHCGKPTGAIHDLDPTIADALICWYIYDPELQTFRRSCEGET